MIGRYTLPEMSALWSDESRYAAWLEVELAVLEVLAGRGVVPQDAVQAIKKKACIDVRRIEEIEKTTKHDVIAFTTSIAEQCGAPARYFHYGLTSSDVVDTAWGLLMVRAGKLLVEEVEALRHALKKQALRHRNLHCIGRTHGMHAEPTIFGLKFLGWYAEMGRQRSRLKRAVRAISRGKLSGAVGVYGALPPDVESDALSILSLKPELVSTQVVPRDRHAEFVCAIAQLGGSMERIAVELRHLQRSEVDEVEEDFTKGQKGSSAMPHKKNPISSENITGGARLLRGYAVTALENVALWHERDISHSSAERVILPDATTLAHYMLVRLRKIIAGLNVKVESVKKNLDASQGVYFSGQVLLQLVERGLSREEAYRLVQACAHRALEERRPLQELISESAEIGKVLPSKELNSVFDLNRLTRHADQIYERVLKDEAFSRR